MITSFKSLSAGMAIVFLLIPASFARASSSPETLIANLLEADSAEMMIDVDLKTYQEELQQPVSAHVGFDFTSNVDDDAQMETEFWFTDESGNFQQEKGSMIITSDALYFSKDSEEWYALEFEEFASEELGLEEGDEVDALEEIRGESETIQAVLEDLFDRGIIEYSAESPEYINRVLTMRYGYQINTDNFIDMMLEEDAMSEDEAEETRAYLSENVSISGKFWVDVDAMLPVMLTLNVNVDPEGDSYTTVESSIFFKSFNEEVEIEIPEDAMSFEEADFGETEEVLTTSFSSTVSGMDTDGDGLTNDEEMTWDTDPLNDDTDGDGYQDETEVVNGYDPNGVGRATSAPITLMDDDGSGIDWSKFFDAYRFDR